MQTNVLLTSKYLTKFQSLKNDYISRSALPVNARASFERHDNILARLGERDRKAIITVSVSFLFFFSSGS